MLYYAILHIKKLLFRFQWTYLMYNIYFPSVYLKPENKI